MMSTTKQVLIRLLLINGLLIASSVMAQDATDERDRAMIDILVRSYEARPDPAFQFLMAESYARLGEKTKAVSALKVVANSDRPYFPPNHSPLWQLGGDPEFEAVVGKLDDRLPRTRNGVERHRVQGLVAEGMAYDPVTQMFLLGDIRQQRIVSVKPNGTVATIAAGLELQPFGMAVDAPRRRLWVASSLALGDPDDAPRSQLLRIDLSTGEIKAFSDPSMVALNDVAVAPNGDVYTTDFGGNAIWHLPNEATTPVRFGGKETAIFPNGIAIEPTGKIMFVAQGSRIVALDLTNGSPRPLAKPENLDTLGTDGLYFHDGHLFGIQNATSPGRVIRMDLDEGMKAIIGYEILESCHPAFELPTTGAIAENQLVVLANSQIFKPHGDNLNPLTLIGYDLSKN